MQIPLARPDISDAEFLAIKPVIDSGWLGMGTLVGDLETAVCEFVGSDHCIAVSSGTAALHLALEIADVRGAEVVVPSMTFAATVQAVLAAGGVPVFAECRPEDLNLDVEDASRRITPRTKAIVPVHYAGKPVDMDHLLEVASAAGVTVVEDAAHAFGSTWQGKAIGAFGHLTCFSFDPIKTITCGEGGAVCTSNPEWAERIRCVRNLGITHNTWDRYQSERPWMYEVAERGYRAHMSNINAAIGLVQMNRVEELIADRRQVAAQYDEAFSHLPDISCLDHDLAQHVPFCYTVRIHGHRRDAFMTAMKAAGVGVGILYLPNHTQPAFQAFTTSLPVTERLSAEYVSLPLFGGMQQDAVDYVIEHVRTFMTTDQ